MKGIHYILQRAASWTLDVNSPRWPNFTSDTNISTTQEVWYAISYFPKNALLRIGKWFWHQIGYLALPVFILIHRFAAQAHKDFLWRDYFSSSVVIEHPQK